MMAKKRLRRGERGMRGRQADKAERISLLMGARGTAPLLGQREAIFQRAKKRGIQAVLLHLATKRAFRSIAGTGYFLDSKTKAGIRNIVKEMHKKKAVRFGKETSVDLACAESIAALMGKAGAKQFMRYFSQYLQDEANFRKSHTRLMHDIMEKEW